MAPFAQSECHKEARTVIQLLKLFRFATFFAATLPSLAAECRFCAPAALMKNVQMEIGDFTT